MLSMNWKDYIRQFNEVFAKPLNKLNELLKGEQRAE